LNLLVYILPVVALLGGGIWLFIVLRRWSAGATGDGVGSSDPETRLDSPTGQLSDEDEAWLRRSIGGR
jgi:hypothetical protein